MHYSINRNLIGFQFNILVGKFSWKLFFWLKTCFKNPTKPTYIDLIVTNRPKCFQDTVVFETGLSDFHKMSVTVMKMYYAKQKPSIV